MGQVKPLSLEQLKSRIITKDVELPDGATVRIRSIPAACVVREDGFLDRKGSLLALSLVDEDNQLMFSEDECEKVLELFDGPSMKALSEAINEINGFGEAAEKN